MTKLIKGILATALFSLFLNEGWTSEMDESCEEFHRNEKPNLKIVDTDARDQLLCLLSRASSFYEKMPEDFRQHLTIFKGNAIFVNNPFGGELIYFDDESSTWIKTSFDPTEWLFKKEDYNAIKKMSYISGIKVRVHPKKMFFLTNSGPGEDLFFIMRNLFIKMFALEQDEGSGT